MCFNTDPITHGELIHRLTHSHNGPGPLVPRRKGTKRQGERKMSIVNLQIGATGSTHRHLHQHLARAGLWYRAMDHADVPWPKEYSGTHGLRNRGLLYVSSSVNAMTSSAGYGPGLPSPSERGDLRV